MRARYGLLAAIAVLAGCSTTVQGTPTAQSFDGSVGTEFTDLLTECDAVADGTIAETVGGDAIARGFFGAICRWDVASPNGIVKVTFDWFENGSLDAERSANARLEYDVEDIAVQGRTALLITQPEDPAACGVTAGSPNSGVVGWWVQYQPGSQSVDPCAAATTLMELTIDLSR